MAAREITEDDVTASVEAYIDTGTDSTYGEAIRAALETYEARRAVRNEIHVPVKDWVVRLHNVVETAPPGTVIVVPTEQMRQSGVRTAKRKGRDDLVFEVRYRGDPGGVR